MITRKVESYKNEMKHLSEMVGAFITEIFVMKIIACALILMAMLLDVAALGLVQVVRAWSDIFR